MNQIIIPVPLDAHLHVRQGERMFSAVRYAAMHFDSAIIMPNTAPSHTVTVSQAREYREQILAAVPRGAHFEPLMTLSLKPETTPEIIQEAKASGFIYGVKLYAGHTTNSEGFVDVFIFYPVFASRFGREFYGIGPMDIWSHKRLPSSDEQLILTREEVKISPIMEFGETQVAVFHAEVPLKWKVERDWECL